jgi:hypothetical protein
MFQSCATYGDLHLYYRGNLLAMILLLEHFPKFFVSLDSEPGSLGCVALIFLAISKKPSAHLSPPCDLNSQCFQMSVSSFEAGASSTSA